MSSEQTFSTSDLRSTAQDYKRAAARKYKWALGPVERVGRPAGSMRPHRPSETCVLTLLPYNIALKLTCCSDYNIKRRETKSAVASLAHGTKIARKHDMLEGTSNAISDSSDSNSDHEEIATSPPADVDIMYSFDAAHGPSHGSEILNVALAKAVQKFEEKETVKLVKNEYDIIDSEGESVGLTPVKKGKGKAKAEPVVVRDDEDEEYEFI
jgi:hypothetical protein